MLNVMAGKRVSPNIDGLPHGQSGRVPRAPIGALGLQSFGFGFLEQFKKNIGMNVVLKCSMIIKSFECFRNYNINQ